MKCHVLSCRIIKSPKDNRKELDDVFACKYCEKVFLQKKYLNSHLKKHVEEYLCEVCSKSFSNSQNLKKHQTNIHHVNIVNSDNGINQIKKNLNSQNSTLCETRKILKSMQESERWVCNTMYYEYWNKDVFIYMTPDTWHYNTVSLFNGYKMAPCRRKTWLILVIDLTVGKFVTILNFIVFGRRVAVASVEDLCG